MDEEKTIFDALKGDYNEKDHVQISYFVHEAEMARQERTIKRLWILCIIMFLALVVTNAGWIWYESQFEDIVVTQDNGDAPNNYIGNDGSIYNGAESFGMEGANGKADDQSSPQEDGR